MSHQNVVEHTISTDDEEGVLNTHVPSDSPTEAGGATTPPPSKIKKYAVPISVTLLALSAIAIAAVVWAPGGPGRPNSIQANLATNTRGTDTESEPTASVNDTYAPTYFPTSSLNGTNSSLNGTDSPVASPSTTSLPTSYMPTVDTGSTNSTESPVLPTTNNGTDSPVASPSTYVPTTPQATTYVPTVGNETEEIEEGATPKPTPPPLDLSWLSPTPPPMESTPFPTTSSPTVAANTTSSVPTSTPTIESTGQGSATVSTETTGPPTAANRPPAPARM